MCRKQQLILSMLLTMAAAGSMTAQSNYRPTPLAPVLSQARSGESSRSLSDLVIDHYEITNPSRGEVKIVVVNKGGGSSRPSTLRLIVLKAGRLGQKATATVFATVPALSAGQTTFIFVKAGVQIGKRKHAISIDLTEESK
jgi:tartrate dehydratase alpha subunit/fumarate hydratase class I-like protein